MCPLKSNSQDKRLHELTETLLFVFELWLLRYFTEGGEFFRFLQILVHLLCAFASQAGWNWEPKAVVAPGLSPALGI